MHLLLQFSEVNLNLNNHLFKIIEFLSNNLQKKDYFLVK